MHTDDHILETLLAASRPLAAVAAELRMSFIALVRWMDANADLLAAAKRALESHIKLLALRAEAVALVDLTNVSSSTPNEERKRKSASQLLRHSAKRLLAPSPRNGGEKYPSDEGARGMRGGAIASMAVELPRAQDSLPAPTCSTANAESRMPNAAPAPKAPSPKPSLADRLAALRLAAMTSA